MKLNIGYFGRQQKSEAEELVEKLEGYETGSFKEVKRNVLEEDINHVLLSEDMDIYLIPLPLIPPVKLKDYVIAGLSKRSEPFDSVYFKKWNADEIAGPLKIRPDARIVVLDDRSLYLARHLFPAWEVELKTRVEEIFIEELLLSYDGIIIPSYRGINSGIQDEIERFDFHPREFIPAPGAGVTAWVCRGNNPALKKIIHSNHHSLVSNVTNIERSIWAELLSIGFKGVGVYVSLDNQTNYHVSASGSHEEKKIFHISRHSAGTSDLLKEEVVKRMLT